MELTNANPISMYVVMLNSIICFGLYQISWTVSFADVFCVFKGYAYLDTVCTTSDYRYSIIEFNTLNIAWTAAHELGHA